MITDTHTHLYSEQFDQDRALMVQRAKDAGVHRFFIPAIDSSYTERMLSLETQYPNDVFLMMGLHPTSVKENFKEIINKDVSSLSRPDYWGGYSFKPYYFEFWKGDKNRLNKRDKYELNNNVWEHSILQP